MNLKEELWLEPDPVWTDRFEDERERVQSASDDGLLGVFHVGSTAIPDVPGKPALDVLAVYADFGSLRAAAGALTELDPGGVDGTYELHAEDEESALVIRWADDHAVFVKMHTRDDEKVRNQLVFREFLREDADARREYERVKREAAADHPEDPAAYTEAKSAVVADLLERAHAEGYAEDLPAFA